MVISTIFQWFSACRGFAPRSQPVSLDPAGELQFPDLLFNLSPFLNSERRHLDGSLRVAHFLEWVLYVTHFKGYRVCDRFVQWFCLFVNITNIVRTTAFNEKNALNSISVIKLDTLWLSFIAKMLIDCVFITSVNMQQHSKTVRL